MKCPSLNKNNGGYKYKTTSVLLFTMGQLSSTVSHYWSWSTPIICPYTIHFSINVHIQLLSADLFVWMCIHANLGVYVHYAFQNGWANLAEIINGIVRVSRRKVSDRPYRSLNSYYPYWAHVPVRRNILLLVFLFFSI